MKTIAQLTAQLTANQAKHLYLLELYSSKMQEWQWRTDGRTTPPPVPPTQEVHSDWKTYTNNKEDYLRWLVYGGHLAWL